MAYEKQTWQSGDVVTSAKLNNMEDGIDDANCTVAVNVRFVDMDAFQMAFSYMKRVGDINSVEGVPSDIYFPSSAYRPFIVSSVPLDPGGEYTLGIMMSLDYATSSSHSITTTGGVSSEYVTVQVRTGASSWASVPYAFFPITGNGTMTITYTE